MVDGTEWLAHAHKTVPWQQISRGGNKADRMLREGTVSLPPLIAGQAISLDQVAATSTERALRAITELDAVGGADLASLGLLLLRTESVASSKIEAVEASIDDYASALHGVRTNSSAISMAAATKALELLVGKVTSGGRIVLADVTEAQYELMRDDPSEQQHAGLLRPMQNWIGGSDYSPRGAAYVPPPAESVPNYMNDLIAFSNRDDLPALVQAAIAHAQFESIHPFTDGNGRIGRSLINTVLRRRGATTRVVVPLASSLVVHRDRYFDLLTGYRRGEVEPLIISFAAAAEIAARESLKTATRLRAVPSEWQSMIGTTRRGSAVAQLLAQLPGHPILNSDDAAALVGAPRSSIFAAISRLVDSGVLRPLTSRKKDQVWGAGLILDELDDLGVRIASASR